MCKAFCFKASFWGEKAGGQVLAEETGEVKDVMPNVMRAVDSLQCTLRKKIVGR
jgi:hypothetical protein